MADGDTTKDGDVKKAQKSYEREFVERRVDDAHALIPFMYGAFYQPSLNRLHIGLPLLEYKTPKIDLATGKWIFHTNEAMNNVKTAMKMCNRKVLDVMTIVKRNEKQTTALVQILTNFNNIDKKIYENILKHRNIIAENHSKIKMLLLDDLNSEFQNGDKDIIEEVKDGVKTIMEKEAALDLNAIKKLPIKIKAGLENESFYGYNKFDKFLEVFKIPANRSTFEKYLKSQEEERVDLIVYSIKTWIASYEKIIENFNPASNDFISREKMEKLLAGISKSTDGEDDTLFSFETNACDAYITKFLSYLLMERVELFFCHVYTYLAAMIGKYPDAVLKLTKDVVDAAVISCTLPILESAIPDQHALDDLYRSIPDTKQGKLIRSLVQDGKKHYIFNEDLLFTKYTPSTIDDNGAKWKIKTKIHESIWKKSSIPELSKSVVFEDRHIDGNFTTLRVIADNMKKATDSLNDVFKNCDVNRVNFFSPSTYKVDKARDVLANHIQYKLNSSAKRSSFYGIASNILYYNHRVNPLFAGTFVFKDKTGEDRTKSGTWYYYKINSPLSVVFDADGKTVTIPPAPTGISNESWRAIPNAVDFVKSSKANIYLNEIKLKNLDAITPLITSRKSETGKSTLQVGKLQNKGKNNTKGQSKGTAAKSNKTPARPQSAPQAAATQSSKKGKGKKK